jgi:hypothetical protein
MINLGQGMALIPLTEKLRAELERSYRRSGKPASAGMENHSDAVASWIAEASADTTLVWFEATYFGGWGGQTSVVWQNREVVIGPESDPNAINRALRILGVQTTDNLDEFDTLKLGRYRHTRQWLGLRVSKR